MLPEDGMYVEVYWNLHKNIYSVRRKGLVVHHGAQFQLLNAKFAVQPAGREKVLREQKKNVHAFVRGFFRDFGHEYECSTLVSYNPYKHDSFVNKNDGSRVDTAKKVYLTISEVGMPVMLADLGG